MSYKAIVTKIKTKDHPNADRLQLGIVNGYQVIVGKDVVDGELGIFFPADGQLSEEFAKANDLVTRTNPDTGKREGGYFAKNRRVRAQTLRGEKSYGFWCELSALSFTGGDISSLKEGDQIDSFNWIPICNKYVTPATEKIQKEGKTKQRRKEIMFPKHLDTTQLRDVQKATKYSVLYNRISIAEELKTKLILSEKLHGTSARYGYVKVNVPQERTWWQKLWGLKPKVRQEWAHVTGSRNVILKDDKTDKTFFDDESFRTRIAESFVCKLRKGEVVYGEIVGDTPGGMKISPPHDTRKVKGEIPELLEVNEDGSIDYMYGCQPFTCKFYVYRIIMINEDGEYIEYSDQQMRGRAMELGLDCVPVLDVFIGETDLDILTPEFIEEYYLSTPSVLSNKCIKEGVVIRAETHYDTKFIKHKSYAFGVMEGYIKDNDSYVDMEESS